MEAMLQQVGNGTSACGSITGSEPMDSVGRLSAEQRSKADQVKGGKISTAQIMRLIEEQEYKCALSGVELTPKDAALDHKMPLARGGSHTIDNAQVLHADVNRAKGSLTNDEFIAMCRRVALHMDKELRQ